MDSSVQDIRSDLESGEGLYEPIVVAYDPENGYAIVAEGNHRVEAAIQAGEEFVPVVVVTGNVSTNKSGEATPELVEKTPGARFEAELTKEVNPYFIFPDSDILGGSKNVDLNQGLPGIAEADKDIAANRKSEKSLDERTKSVFAALRSQLNLPGENIEVSPQELGKIESDSVAANKKSIANILRAVRDSFSSKAQWKRPWRNVTENPAISYTTGQEFKSFNLLALGSASSKKGYSDPRWLTLEQAEKNGFNLKDSEQPTTISVPYVNKYTAEGKTIEVVDFKEVEVYNAEQFDGVDAYERPEKVTYTTDEALQLILDRFNQAEIARGRKGLMPIYGKNMTTGLESPEWSVSRGIEKIDLPLREQFDNDEDYLVTVIHELAHSTGRSNRLNRDQVYKMSDDSRQREMEEVTAEMAAATLMSRLGFKIEDMDSATYIAESIRRANLSNEEIQSASMSALNAAEYVLGNDVLPAWDPSGSKKYVSETEDRNNRYSRASDAINTMVGQQAIAKLESELSLASVSAGRDTPKRTQATVNSSQDAITKVLSGIQEALKEGFKNRPWRKPFKDGRQYIGGSGLPRNPLTKRFYTGTNAFILKFYANIRGYEDSRWMTYNQAQEMGGQVRKGAKSVSILVPRVAKYDKNKDGSPILDANGNPTTRKYVYFTTVPVFNVAEIDGLNLKDDVPTTDMEPLEAQQFIIDRYIKSMKNRGLKAPTISYTYVGNYGDHFFTSTSPNWSPVDDTVTLPQQAQFNDPEAWFETLMHELVHSTGHKARLDRSEITNKYGTDPSARGLEELIAEMGAATLAEMFNVNYDSENMTAYLEGWQKAISTTDLSSLQQASSMAQQAVDYLLGIDLGDWSPLEGYGSYLGKQGQEGDEE